MKNASSVLILCAILFNISLSDEFSAKNISKPKCTDGQTEMFPHESDCTKYYDCDHGVLHERNCPEGTHFSPESLKCDYPNVAKCDLKPEINCENSEKSFIPHEDNCSMFHLCLSGWKFPLNCKMGWEFDYDKQNCVKISDTGCIANKP